jgi:hypothetical protein
LDPFKSVSQNPTGGRAPGGAGKPARLKNVHAPSPQTIKFKIIQESSKEAMICHDAL